MILGGEPIAPALLQGLAALLQLIGRQAGARRLQRLGFGLERLHIGGELALNFLR